MLVRLRAGVNNGERERGGEREKVTDEEEKEREREREGGWECVLCTYCNFVGKRGRGGDSVAFLASFFPPRCLFLFLISLYNRHARLVNNDQ